MTSSSPSPCCPPVAPRSTGAELRLLPNGGVADLALTVLPLAGETPADTLSRCLTLVREHDAAIVQQTVFGEVSAAEAALSRVSALTDRDWPLTWVEGTPVGDSPLAGVHVYGVKDREVQTLWREGRPVGRCFQADRATVCHVGELGPADLAAEPGTQARQFFENLEAVLSEVGMDLSHVARTWLYLDSILSWYGDFNHVRTQFFEERGVFDGLVPASTGIEGSNPTGSAIIAQALAMRDGEGKVAAAELASPLQCPAPQYGSSFSRAAELHPGGRRWVTVSGTASINAEGESVFLGDVERQVAFTLEVIEAILATRQMSLSDVVRMYAYFKHPHDASALERYCKERGLSLPAIPCSMDVCRDDLLFETEVEAVVSDG